MPGHLSLRLALAVVAVLALVGPAPAADLSGAAIMKKQRETQRLKDEEERQALKLISKSGAAKERKLVRYLLSGPGDLDKILVRFLAPRDVENTGLLTWEGKDGNDDQWLYLPTVKRPKRIAASGKKNRFLGTDFAYEDLRAENVAANTYALVGSEAVDGVDCFVVDATPATERQASDSGYGRRRIWVRKDTLVTVKREYYDKQARLEKVETHRRLVNVAGPAWRADEIEMHDVVNGTRTVITVESRAVNRGLKDDFFTETELAPVTRALLWILDHPVTSCAAVLVVTLLLGWQIPRLRIDESAEGLTVQHDPGRAVYEKAKLRFGNDNFTVVLVKADDVFAPDVLAAVKRLSDGLAALPAVTRVESLTTVKNIKGEGDALDTDPLVEALPGTAAEVERIRADALGNRVLIGNLVARDARATGITVYADPRPDDTGFSHRFVGQVEALIARESRPGLTIYQVGAPYTKATYADYLKTDQKTIIPLSIAVLLVTLWLSFRMLQGVVIPLATAVVSIVWSLGLMAVFDLPITILTAILPSLLLAIGFTEDVHMISQYHHRLELGDDKLTALRTMLTEAALPILITTGTTVVGFGSLVTTDITMLIQFGWAASLGLTANFVVTLALLPPLLRFWRVPRRFRRAGLTDESSHGTIPRLMQRLGEFNLRYRVPILIVTGLLTAGSLVGWYSLRVNTDLISFFPERSPIRTRIEDLHRSLAGGLGFYIVLDTGRADGAKDPAFLTLVAGLQDYLAGTGMIDRSVSVADYLRKMHREMHGGDPAFETIPATSDQVAQYLLMLEGQELTKFIDFDASAANIVVRHNLTGSGDLSALLRRIDAWVAGNVPPHVSVKPTGETILFNNASDYMAINELTSFAWTFLLIGVIHALLFMSVKAGALSLVPNVVPILFNYGLMGLLGIPLNTGNALIASIAIGIAVDDTVHHMVTYNRQLNIHHDQKIAMFNTMRAQGRPIIYVSLALAAGFLALTFSNFVPTVQFGWLAAGVMLLAMAGELILTPILMYSTRLVTLWELVQTRMHPTMVHSAPLLQGLSRWEARKVVLLGRLDSVPAGQFVVRKGERGTEMYMVVSGRVRVSDRLADGTEKVLAHLEPGAVFGEMALVSQEPRSASVVAETPAEVLRLDLEAFERIRRRFPFTGAKLFRNLARVLALRLRHTTAMLVEGQPLAVVPGAAERA